MTLTQQQVAGEIDALVAEGKWWVESDPYHAEAPGLAARTIARWPSLYEDVGPRQLYESFARGIEGLSLHATIDEVNGASRARIAFRAPALECSGFTAPSLIVWPSSNYAEVMDIFLKPGKQHRHAIHPLMEACVEQTRALGVSKLDITTARIGGHAWAKFGFAPKTAAEWKHVKKSVAERWKFICHHNTVPKEIHDTVEAILKSDKPSDIGLLAEQTFKVHTPIFKAEHDDENVKTMVSDEEKKWISLGKALLIGLHYHAVLDFNDTPSMQRYNGYLNREPSIHLAAATRGTSQSPAGFTLQ